MSQSSTLVVRLLSSRVNQSYIVSPPNTTSSFCRVRSQTALTQQLIPQYDYPSRARHLLTLPFCCSGYRDCEISLYCRSQGYDDDQPQLGLEESQSLNKYHGSGVGTALLVTVETPRSRLLEDKLNDTIIDSIPRRKFDGHSGLTPSRKLELLPSK